MIGRNFIVRNMEIYYEQIAKKLPENSLPLPRSRKKNEIISLNFDFNDHVYSKFKSI